MGLRELCLFCGSSAGARPEYRRAAIDLARELVARDIGLVYGGGAVGLMGVAADEVMSGGGRVTGVIPRDLFGNEVEHGAITTLHRVDSMHERKAKMYELADAFVALPGGLGTLEELAETLTWGQIGLHDKPIGLLGTAGFYEPLCAFLTHAVEEGFVKIHNLDRLIVDNDPTRLLDRVTDAAAQRSGRVDLRPL
jgi:uncharacterized protein (TIGR00730 family)